MKCLPLKYLTKGFGAVKLISASGLKLLPGPDDGGPVSMFQDEGASTERTGSIVAARASMMDGNGSRTSPVKEKPVNSMSFVGSERKGRGEITENCIYNLVGFLKSRMKVVDEWNG